MRIPSISADCPAARAKVNPNLMLAHALAEARAKGIPAFLVASASGISPAYLSMVVHGQRRPSRRTAQAISDSLGVSVHELFT